MPDHKADQEFSLKSLFLPLTTFKAIHWILVTGIIVYANMLLNPSVWDDKFYIFNNPEVQNFNISTFFGNNIFNNTGQYRPFTVAYFSLLHTLFGSQLFFYHMTQLALHIVNTVLLFILFKTFFNKKLALSLSIVFLIHPMQVESVSYISASASPLFFLFGISALLITISRKETYVWTGLQFLLLLSSMLIKETGFLFILLVLLYQYLFKKINNLSTLILGFLTVLLYIVIRVFVGGIYFSSRPLIPIAQLTFWERLFTMPEVILYYIKTFFFPITLAVNQQWVISEPSFSQFYIPLLIDVLFIVFVFTIGFIFYKKKSSNMTKYIFFVAWSLLGLAFHSQIIPLDMTVADRWAYLSIAGMLGIVGVIFQDGFFLKVKHRRIIGISIAVLIIVFFATRTIVRNIDWQEPVHLWKQAITVNDNFLSQQELALVLTDAGRFDEALTPAKNSVAQFPNDNNLYNLGYIYEQMGKTKDAEKIYYQAYKAKHYIPWEHRHYLIVYARLAIVLIHHKNYYSAREVLTTAVNDYPKDSLLWAYLAASEYELGNKEKALETAQKALILSPQNQQINILYQRIRDDLPIDLTYTI